MKRVGPGIEATYHGGRERERERERVRERERKNILECLSTLSFKTKS